MAGHANVAVVDDTAVTAGADTPAAADPDAAPADVPAPLPSSVAAATTTRLPDTE